MSISRRFIKPFVLLLALQCALCSAAVNISGNVSKALNHMQQGYIVYAVDIIKKAAATNDLLAQYYIAQCYENGIGLPEDKTQAFGMYRRAAERGLPAAMKQLSRLYNDGIGVYQSTERAQEWQERYMRKSDNDAIPDIIGIYNQGIAFADNYSATPETNSVPLTAKSAATGKNKQPQPRIQSEKTPKPIPAPVAQKSSMQPTPVSKSDVDIDIPLTRKVNEHIFAFIFANENYQDVAAVPNAINDGESVAGYCRRTLGIPETNIHLVKNATLNNIRRELNLMKQIAEVYKDDASFIIYYAGHGIPDEETRNAYLFPVDGFVGDLSTCLSLKDFYGTIGKLPVKRSLILLDACFSGATRANEMLASARGVVIRPKEAGPSGNTLVIASAQGTETSYSYNEKRHGLFTYYLLKKIKESKGEMTVGSLFDYIKDNVSKKSIVVNGKSQTPSVIASPDIVENWEMWKIK